MYNRYRYMHCKHLHISCAASKVGVPYTENNTEDVKRDDLGVSTESFVIHLKSAARVHMRTQKIIYKKKAVISVTDISMVQAGERPEMEVLLRAKH